MMRNPQLYIAGFVLGVIAVILGVLYLMNALGHHPLRAYVALAVGIILLIIGAVGMLAGRPKRQA
jgi:hypothetical protein